jgi:hypothetical protein
MWFALSAARGNLPAAKNRDAAAGFMTPGEIAKAQKLAREWKPKPGHSEDKSAPRHDE